VRQLASPSPDLQRAAAHALCNIAGGTRGVDVHAAVIAAAGGIRVLLALLGALASMAWSSAARLLCACMCRVL
jgi:hypothetical protein